MSQTAAAQAQILSDHAAAATVDLVKAAELVKEGERLFAGASGEMMSGEGLRTLEAALERGNSQATVVFSKFRYRGYYLPTDQVRGLERLRLAASEEEALALTSLGRLPGQHSYGEETSSPLSKAWLTT